MIGTRDAGLLYSFDGGRKFRRVPGSVADRTGDQRVVPIRQHHGLVELRSRHLARQARLHWTGLTKADICPFPKACFYFDGFKLSDAFPIEDLSTIDN